MISWLATKWMLTTKLYTDLSEKETKALAEAVTKLGEPLSQMAVILEADESGR